MQNKHKIIQMGARGQTHRSQTLPEPEWQPESVVTSHFKQNYSNTAMKHRHLRSLAAQNCTKRVMRDASLSLSRETDI